MTSPDVQAVLYGSHRAENIAEVAVFFASERGSRSTGNVLNVDGGVTAASMR
ncbi:MAG: hypothetical protein ABR972_05965 [Acidimicrobiales bacterium]